MTVGSVYHMFLSHEEKIEEHYWSQQGHYSASHLTLFVSFPPSLRSVSVCPKRTGHHLLFITSPLVVDFFHSRNTWYEGAPGVFSVQTPLYTTSKRVNESQSRPSYAHFFHLLCNSLTVSLKLFRHIKFLLHFREENSPWFRNKEKMDLMLGMNTSLNFVGTLPSIYNSLCYDSDSQKQ